MEKRDGLIESILFGVLMLGILFFTFFKDSFNVPYNLWHIFLHGSTIIFCIGILLYSLKLKNKSIKFFIFGSLLFILGDVVSIVSHLFLEYSWLRGNLFVFSAFIVGIFLFIIGFEEASK